MIILDSNIVNVRPDKVYKILSGTKDIFFELGIRSMSMELIAKKLGISKKTLYSIVRNKKDLVTKVMVFTLDQIKSTVINLTSTNENAIEEMLSIFKFNEKISSQINSNLLQELEKYFPDSYEVLINFRKNFLCPVLIDNIKKGISQNLYQADVKPDLVIQFYMSYSLKLYEKQDYILKYTPVQIAKSMFCYHIKGLSNTNGLKYLTEKISEDTFVVV
ncbi:MAG: TetR/AcrR family transcriptional regulator [Bacteroidota bacterium]|nr:TetR/AcrR family transcriptional regulator [Bacteroidota bacterium]